MAAFEAWLVFLILVVNVVGELQRKRTLAASRGFLAAARLSCFICGRDHTTTVLYSIDVQSIRGQPEKVSLMHNLAMTPNNAVNQSVNQ